MDVPQIYACAAKAITSLKNKKGSLRQIMSQYQTNPKTSKAIYAVTTKVLRNIDIIKKIIQSTKLEKEVDCDDAILEVLVGEILFGQRIKDSRSEIVKVVLRNRKKILEKYKKFKKADPSNIVSSLPVKYLRVNLLKSSIDEIVNLFQTNGYHYNNIEDCQQFDEFLKIISNIEPKTFVKDFHFPNELLVINVKDKEDILTSDAYKEGKMIFVDKASVMAVEMLHVKKGMTVLDVCGAPGMKTAAIASRCDNEVNIISIDMDPKRCESMQELLSTTSVNCVDIRCADFLDKNTAKDVKPDVILLDPSCSGTGMFDRLDYGEKNEDTRRCYKLASFQTKMLCKAMSLNPKRIVYSTCSTNVIENELVVKSALKEAENGDKYELVKALPSWPERGEDGLNECIRTGQSYLTKGFFAAVFKRKI